LKSAQQKMQSWIRIRRDLYRQVRAQVEKRQGRHRSIESYQLDYAKEFRRKWRISTPDKLFEALNASQVILLADFHALSQSQKSHLRLLKSMDPSSIKVLALECFYQEDQRWIDRFLAGRVSEHEFLRAIRWTNKWGFPWSHYRKLVLWAVENQIRIVGLNRSGLSENLRTLHDRDRGAAQIVSGLLTATPDIQIIVIYGDLHLAKGHLPEQIQKRILPKTHMTRVFQNSERIYFSLAKRSLENQVDVVDLGNDTFCLNSVPPWVKWQNYLLFLEADENLDLTESDGDLDLNDQVGQYVNLMSHELDLPSDLKQLSVFTAQEAALWNQLEANLDSKSLRGYRLFLENEISFYCPKSQVAFLSRLSVNHAATLAMHFLHGQTAKVKAWGFRGPEDFERLIWVFGLGYFGSKLINPKRKADTLTDIKAAISKPATSEYGKEALKLALAQKMSEIIFMAHRKKQRLTFVPRRRVSYLIAAELLGGLLGERLFNGYRQGLLSLLTLKNLMKKDWSRDDFPLVYFEVMEMIEALPLAFKSKRDKL
jgi:uncharacterized iron-regulated protein